MNERQQEEGKDGRREAGESPMAPLSLDSSPSRAAGMCHITYPFTQTEEAPGSALPQTGTWPAAVRLQKPPCRWVFTPRSSSLEPGLTLSDHN